CSILYNLLLSRQDDRPFLLPANICPIVPITFLKARRPFQLVDVAPPGWTLDARQCLDLAPGAAGVLFVRAYGAEHQDPGTLFRALKEQRPDLLVIDDRCLSRPDVDGERLCPWADVSLYSTGRRKHVDLGYGGFAHLALGVPYRRHSAGFRQDQLDAVEARYLEALERREPFTGGDEEWLDMALPDEPWPHYRERVLDTLAAVDEQKRRLNAIYAAEIPEEARLPAAFQGWRFHVLVPEPDALADRLFAGGLFASRHYQPLAGVFGEGPFPHAEALHARVVNLFNDFYFDEERARRAAGLVREHLAGRG
ncbi:MAG TPA: hypothetical protein VEL74_12085, partial [Thermoanaerobaculia bacterium]|nr:hypothetical protein [Thermoanaerobaculia bacterium]